MTIQYSPFTASRPPPGSPIYVWRYDTSGTPLQSFIAPGADGLLTPGWAPSYGEVAPGLIGLIHPMGSYELNAPAAGLDLLGELTYVHIGLYGDTPTVLACWNTNGPDSRFAFVIDSDRRLYYTAGGSAVYSDRDVPRLYPFMAIYRRDATGTIVDAAVNYDPVTFPTATAPSGASPVLGLTFGLGVGGGAGARINDFFFDYRIDDDARDVLFDMFFEGLDPPPSATFVVVFACAIDARTIRVFLSEEPRARSPIVGTIDALDRRTWSVANASSSPVVLRPKRVQPAPDFSPSYPDAWSVDLEVDRRLLFSQSYTVTAALTLENAAGTAVVDPLYASAIAPIGISNTAVVPIRPFTPRQSFDVAYDTFRGVFPLDAGGDLANHSAPESTKKRVLRRVMSALGSFALLREYGVSVQPKMVARGRSAAVVRAEVLRQLRKETDLVVESVDFSYVANIGLLKIAGHVRSSGEPVGVTGRLRSGRLFLGG